MLDEHRKRALKLTAFTMFIVVMVCGIIAFVLTFSENEGAIRGTLESHCITLLRAKNTTWNETSCPGRIWLRLCREGTSFRPGQSMTVDAKSWLDGTADKVLETRVCFYE